MIVFDERVLARTASLYPDVSDVLELAAEVAGEESVFGGLLQIADLPEVEVIAEFEAFGLPRDLPVAGWMPEEWADGSAAPLCDGVLLAPPAWQPVCDGERCRYWLYAMGETVSVSGVGDNGLEMKERHRGMTPVYGETDREALSEHMREREIGRRVAESDAFYLYRETWEEDYTGEPILYRWESWSVVPTAEALKAASKRNREEWEDEDDERY